MSEGLAAGAGVQSKSGLDEPSYFNHQPPTVEHFDDPDQPHPSPQLEEAHHDGNETHHIITPRPSPSPKLVSRAHFPDEPSRLEQFFSPPQHADSESVAERDPATDEKAVGEPEQVRPESGGVWQRVREFWQELKDDFGPAEAHHEKTTNLIGDTGIDIHTLRKLRTGHRTTSIVGPSLLLGSPAIGNSYLRDSSPHSRSGSNTGLATPQTPSKRFQAGIDPKEVSRALHNLKNRIGGRPNDKKEAKYVQAKSDLNARRTLVLLLTYAFMLYGAPSHRIEEYVLQLMQVCNLDGRVNYIVGCTELCFINPPDPNDPLTRQSYTTLVKAQGLDVGALEVAFRIYKAVVHGEVSVEEATKSMTELIDAPPYYRPWVIVPFFGLGSAFACVWAYGGYWLDMPIAFFLGSIVGFLQVIVAARNPLYSNVLEVTAALVTSFGARAFATIGGGQKYFCFAAIAESSITLILPGYIVLCGALELQSKSLTAGSTRLFYAVIYSLFLGYGIDVGSQLWKVIDPAAPTSATCPRTVDPHWKILLVPCYLVLQATLIRSRPKQIPVQVLFGSAAYTVNYFVAKYATSQVADTAAAFVLGMLGHLYARSRHAFAFASVVAGIMVLVPSGLSAQGGLVAGISTPLFNNGTTDAQEVYEQNIYQSFSVGAQMIQVAIGLSVGIFLSALAIYPLGRKNNALFSF
ncbi:hypothetical protein M8818_006010 [Zalaria obscura]|uniref:Uncharacterized protein n=1 Tax=Zalaria obscura TaxID=2024903 RepID=A0ACC3S7P7_9PEZI